MPPESSLENHNQSFWSTTRIRVIGSILAVLLALACISFLALKTNLFKGQFSQSEVPGSLVISAPGPTKISSGETVYGAMVFNPTSKKITPFFDHSNQQEHVVASRYADPFSSDYSNVLAGMRPSASSTKLMMVSLQTRTSGKEIASTSGAIPVALFSHNKGYIAYESAPLLSVQTIAAQAPSKDHPLIITPPKSIPSSYHTSLRVISEKGEQIASFQDAIPFAFSPDDTHLMAYDREKGLVLMPIAGGPAASLGGDRSPSLQRTRIRVSPQGSFMVIGSLEGGISIFSIDWNKAALSTAGTISTTKDAQITFDAKEHLWVVDAVKQTITVYTLQSSHPSVIATYAFPLPAGATVIGWIPATNI
jgi:hypothetical protein